MSDSLLKMIVVVLGVTCTLGIYSILYKKTRSFGSLSISIWGWRGATRSLPPGTMYSSKCKEYVF